MKKKYKSGKLFTCDFCPYTTKDKKEFIRHMKDTHGKIIKKTKSKKKGEREDKGVKLIDGVKYKWNKSREQFDVNESGEYYQHDENNPDEWIDGSGAYHVRCKNCNKWHVFKSNPYPKDGYPLHLCYNCNLNIFKNNKDKIKKKVIDKDGCELPKKISKKVFEENDNIVKKKKSKKTKLRKI